MHGSALTNMLGAAKAGLGNVGSVAASAGSSLWHGATSFVAGIPGAVANGVGGFLQVLVVGFLQRLVFHLPLVLLPLQLPLVWVLWAPLVAVLHDK